MSGLSWYKIYINYNMCLDYLGKENTVITLYVWTTEWPLLKLM